MGIKFLSFNNEKLYVLLRSWKLHAHFLTAKITQLSWVENAESRKEIEEQKEKN